MARERAALARSILIFFVGLAAAGLLYGVLNQPAETLLSTGADIGETSQAAQGHSYIKSFWNGLPFIMVFLAFFQLVAAAAVEGRLPGQ